MRRPIGVFDSGLGGLTVVRALRLRLPAERLVYFGDTARVPYGIKSSETVTRFALEDGAFLCRWDPKYLIVACNTMSAAAMPALARRFGMPMCGVIEPGARAAVREAKGRPIGVIGTEATIASGAYRDAIRRVDPTAMIAEKACPLLVPLVEEGRREGDRLVRMALEEYLAPLAEAGIGALVLGCTHYPLLVGAIRETLGPEVALVDSAEVVAEEVAGALERQGLMNEGGDGRVRWFVSDNPARFRDVGCRFLGEAIDVVTLVPPEIFFKWPAADSEERTCGCTMREDVP